MHLSFNHTSLGKHEGYLSFLNRTEYRKTDHMTFAGYIELDDQLANVDLEANDTVNPFISVILNQIGFSHVLLEKH